MAPPKSNVATDIGSTGESQGGSEFPVRPDSPWAWHPRARLARSLRARARPAVRAGSVIC